MDNSIHSTLGPERAAITTAGARKKQGRGGSRRLAQSVRRPLAVAIKRGQNQSPRPSPATGLHRYLLSVMRQSGALFLASIAGVWARNSWERGWHGLTIEDIFHAVTIASVTFPLLYRTVNHPLRVNARDPIWLSIFVAFQSGFFWETLLDAWLKADGPQVG